MIINCPGLFSYGNVNESRLFLVLRNFFSPWQHSYEVSMKMNQWYKDFSIFSSGCHLVHNVSNFRVSLKLW